MSSEEGDVYVLQDGVGDEWQQPVPVRTAIVEAIVDRTDLEEADLEAPETYVDWGKLVALLDGDDRDELTFDVEGCEVTVDGDGNISVGTGSR